MHSDIRPERTLIDILLAAHRPEEEIRARLLAIRYDCLRDSRFIREPNFTRIHTGDLEWLLGAYDERFFAHGIRAALAGASLSFYLSPRMTRAGGKTTMIRSAFGPIRYQIAISCDLIFNGFSVDDRSVTVCGLPCDTRLDALQRIFEHELVHLMELLCWKASNCSRPRFHTIASRFFLHRAYVHELVTRSERAAATGIRVGATVTFVHEGRHLTGRVNRITKRATVLVENSTGRRFSDGRHYLTYYVPLGLLSLASTGH